MKRARTDNENYWQKKVEKYVICGMFTKEAEAKAGKKKKVQDITQFNKCYGLLIIQLKDGPIHDMIMNDVKKFMQDISMEKCGTMEMMLMKTTMTLNKMIMMTVTKP